MYQSLINYTLFTPELFISYSTTTVLLVVVYLQKGSGGFNRFTTPEVLKASALVLVFALWLYHNQYDAAGILYTGGLVSFPFIVQNKMGLVLAVFLVLQASAHYLHREKLVQFEYGALVLLATLGMLTIIGTNDLIAAYLGIELQSISFYVLACTKRYSEYSTEAAFKYFILGAVASGFILLSIGLSYGLFGTTNLSEISKALFVLSSESSTAVHADIAITLLIVGILFKLGAAPLHMWVPDVYDGAPTPITALFSAAPKIALFSFMLRIWYQSFFSLSESIQQILIICGLVSIILASLAALTQTRIKRLLAYSTIAHVGFILLGFSVLTALSTQAILFYIINYIVMVITVFTIILAIRTQKSNLQVKYIKESLSLPKINRLFGTSLIIILFSFAGIPPLSGFLSKMYLFVSTLSGVLWVATAVALLFTVVSAIYYVGLIKNMYFHLIDTWTTFLQVPIRHAYIISLGTLFVLVVPLVANTILLTLSESTAFQI